MSEDPLQLAIVKIVGMRYFVHTDFCAAFLAGDIIKLRPEPSNHIDNRAIEVIWGSRKVGYVPRPLNQAIFALIEAGYDIKAEVTGNGEERITISMRQQPRVPSDTKHFPGTDEDDG